MGGEDDPGLLPERVILGQRLLAEHVQHGAADMAGLDLRNQVGIDHMAAAPHVDHIGAGLQQRQRAGVDDVAGLVVQGQQVDQNARLGQKAVQAVHAAEAFDALQLARRAAPAIDLEIEHRQRPGHALAHLAQAHHAHGIVHTPGVALELPQALRHVGLVPIEATEEADHGLGHILGHLHSHARILETVDGQRGRNTQRQQGIHARADVEHGLQAGRLLVEELLGRRPDQCIVGLGCARLPDGNLRTRQRVMQTFEPGFRPRIVTAK